MSEKDKPSRAVFPKRTVSHNTTVCHSQASRSSHKGYLFYFFPPSSDYSLANTAAATCHCLFFTCPRLGGILRNVRSVLSVAVPEVSPCGLWDRKRKWPVCSGSAEAVADISGVLLDLLLCHHESYLGVLNLTLIKGLQIIMFVCV